jgi:hypothetical protein
MFRRTDNQATFGSLSVLLSPEKVARLENKHWAGGFRRKALPVLVANEETFRPLFCEGNGRPNKPVATTLGVLILKEMYDLTDETALDHFAFDTSWQYALEVDPDDAHLCQKTLHNFRAKMSAAEEGGVLTYSALFDEIVQAIVKDKGLKVGKQRLDSTHILSNMAILSRLGLFTQTITIFLKQLQKRHGGMFKSLPAGIIKRYIDREGYFADSPSSESRRRLSQCAADLWRLVDRFGGHRKVSKLDGYRRLERLLKEQCVVEEDPPTDPDGDGPEGVLVRPKDPKKETIPATSLQGSDDDATYGHKGKGYQAQVAETCDEDNEQQVVTHVSLEGAHESDQHAALPVIKDLREKGCKPEVLLVDTNYGRGQNIVDAAEQDVDLMGPSCGSRPKAKDDEATLDDFAFSADGQRVEHCPAGHAPVEQGTCGDKGQCRCAGNGECGCEKNDQCHRAENDKCGCEKTGHRRYARMDVGRCADCRFLARCPAQWSDRTQTMTLRWTPSRGATSARRRREQTKEFKDDYRLRSGIEATNSEYKRPFEGGRLRVRGRPAVDRTVKFKFMALNIRRWTKPAPKTHQHAA